VERDGLGLHLALLDVDLVAAENDGDVLADAGEITCFALLALLSLHNLTSLAGSGGYVRCQLGTFL